MLAVLLLLRSVIALTAAQASLANAPRTNVSRAAVQPGCKLLAFLDGVPKRYACVPPRFFFIGPGSTGTNSLAQQMRSLLPAGAAVCHESCGKELHADASSLVRWDRESQRHDVSLFARTSALGQNCMPPANDREAARQHPGERNARACAVRCTDVAFLDHGQFADFEWLASSFPDASFVLNTRKLRDFLLSRIVHLHDCSNSTHAPCQFTEEQWAVRRAACAQSLVRYATRAAAAQQKQLSFFGSEAERHRARFVAVALCDDPRNGTLALLRDVGQANTSRHITLPFERATAAIRNNEAAPPPSSAVGGAPSRSVLNKGAHCRWEEELVDSVLRRCPREWWHDRDWLRCADKMIHE